MISRDLSCLFLFVSRIGYYVSAARTWQERERESNSDRALHVAGIPTIDPAAHTMERNTANAAHYAPWGCHRETLLLEGTCKTSAFKERCIFLFQGVARFLSLYLSLLRKQLCNSVQSAPRFQLPLSVPWEMTLWVPFVLSGWLSTYTFPNYFAGRKPRQCERSGFFPWGPHQPRL